ncbi:MAG: BamA/TamA family outer membrane protein [Polyangiaceae bacterium]
MTSLLPGVARATGDPDLAWYTLKTKHFHITYPSTLEPLARRVAEVSETVHDRLKGPLAFEPSDPTEVLLTDDSESANGSATALPYNTITLYATAPEDLSPLTNYDDWFLSLITHEYTHILHVDNITGPAKILNAILGKTYSPNQAQPRWIIEGLAVLYESGYTSGGRLRSTLFDMNMRADVLDDNIAEIDDVCGAPQRWPQGSIWYLYGSRFLAWIAETYGNHVLTAVSQDYGGTTLPLAINRSIYRQTGKTYPELYEGFKDRIKRQYKEQMRVVEARGLREGKALTHHGDYAYYPRFAPRSLRKDDKQKIVYYRDTLDDREGLYEMPYDLPAGQRERPAELYARANGITAASFTSAGDLWYTSEAVFKNYYDRDDIFFVPSGKKAPRGDEPERRRVTYGQRTPIIDVRADGKQAVFVVNSKGTTFLEIADIGKDHSLQNKRDLVPSARFEQVYTPRYSPDGRYVAYSHWRAGGYRDIRVADVATGQIWSITNDRAIDMHPVFSPDQKTLYFVSDRTGIANVYAYTFATGALKQVTNVRTGAYAPDIRDDGKAMVYMGYSTRGWDIFAMDLDPSRYLDAQAAPTDVPDPLPVRTGVPMTIEPYSPLPTVRPRSWFLDIGPGNYSGASFTLSTDGSDVAGIHRFYASATIDPGAPTPSAFVSYNYNRLPVNLGVRAFYTVTPRDGVRVNDQILSYNEHAAGITTGVSLPIYDEFGRHSLGISYSVARYTAELPTVKTLDPYATTTRYPREGSVNILHAGYSYSNVEGYLRSPGPARGVSLTLDLDYGGQPTASNYTTFQVEATATGYIPMPWSWKYLQHHVLALRAAGGASSGTYPGGNAYFVGGYDLAKHNLPDSITSGVFNGAFVLRGYAPRAFGGKEYLLGNAEYRFPILSPDRGFLTLPLYLRRIDGNLFMDVGGAFNDLDARHIRLFKENGLLTGGLFHASVGAELWMGFLLGYGISTQLRLGWARGLTGDALYNGQWYFVASSAF